MIGREDARPAALPQTPNEERSDAGGRSFSEQEANAILRRALELQASANAHDASTDDPARVLSLGDLEQVAASLGLEPHHVEAAAAEIGAPAVRGRRWWPLGVAPSVELERRVDGVLTEDAWEALVEEIRRGLRQTGTCGRLGRTLEWNSAMGAVRVTARPEEAQTRLRLVWHSAQQALIFAILPLYSAVGAGALSEALHLSPAAIAATVVGMTGGGLLAAHAAAGAFIRARTRKYTALIDRLRTLAGEATADTNRPESAQPAPPPTRTL